MDTIKRKKAMTMSSVLIALLVISAIIIPITKWNMEMFSNVETHEKNLASLNSTEEKSILLQDCWDKFNRMSYDEIEKLITSKGLKWTEPINDNYFMEIKIGTKKKYENAICQENIVASDKDSRCRKISLSLMTKENSEPILAVSMNKIVIEKAQLDKLQDGGGYVKFDNGLILQYGKLTNVPLDETWHNVTYPITFPTKTAGISVTLSPLRGKGIDGRFATSSPHYGFVNGSITPMAREITTQGMKVGADLYGGCLDCGYSYGDIYWIAIGF